MTASFPPAIPAGLRRSFIAHFVADLLFAVPLFIAPQWTLTVLGWQSVDPFTTRIAAAALFGVGIESFLGRDASIEVYRGMLNLKIIWSLACVVGIALSLFQRAQGRPMMAWGFLLIFVLFHALWIYWRVIVSRLSIAARES
jgi:hypothetical protein